MVAGVPGVDHGAGAVTPPGKWFLITEGEHAGKPHMTGWLGSAIRGMDMLREGDGWQSFSVCPRCGAMVRSHSTKAWEDDTWKHEQWHHLTDWPVPPEIQRAVLAFAVSSKART
jgi:hypothetical protein